jgi:hypothetical protein
LRSFDRGRDRALENPRPYGQTDELRPGSLLRQSSGIVQDFGKSKVERHASPTPFPLDFQMQHDLPLHFTSFVSSDVAVADLKESMKNTSSNV